MRHPLSKALLLELAGRYPDALPLSQLLPAAQRRVQAAGAGHADEVDALLAELFGLFARGNLRASLHPRRSVAAVAPRPAATALARAQVASGQDQVATIDHGNLGVDALAARLIGYLDGTRTVPELAARLQADLASGALRPTDASARPAIASPAGAGAGLSRSAGAVSALWCAGAIRRGVYGNGSELHCPGLIAQQPVLPVALQRRQPPA